VKRRLPDDHPRVDDLENEPEEEPSDTAGQSGDDQGLSPTAEANEESVKELLDTDQAYEAEVVEGVEEAADHPEKPVPQRGRPTP